MDPVTIAFAVNTAVSVGTKLYDYFSGKSAAQDAADKLEDKKSDIMKGVSGVGQSFEGELRLGDERTGNQLKQLTQFTASKLEDVKTKESDRISSFAHSGAEEGAIAKTEKSVWDSYMAQESDIRDKAEDLKIGAYGRLGQGVQGVKKQYDDILNQIEGLGV